MTNNSYLLIGLLAAAPIAAQVDVLTERYDGARSGLNLNETTLNKNSFKNGKFGKLAFRIVDGNVYAQPLVVSQAKIVSRPSPVNVVIVATEHNSVYAFDGDDVTPEAGGVESAKALWHTGPDVLGDHVESDELKAKLKAPDCSDLTTEVGITGTPHIVLTKNTSPKEGVIFVAAKSKTGATYQHRVFALSLLDGKPLGDGKGVPIEGQVATESGTIAFDPVFQLNRPALLVDNNTLYISFGGHCDAGQYHGWVFAYDVSNLASPRKLDAFSSTLVEGGTGQNGGPGRGGIWMSGQGPAADGNGNVYFITGDGTYDVSKDNFRSLGDSLVKVKLVAGKIQVQDWFSPKNRDELLKLDADFGSSGPVMVPNSQLLLAGGKEGRMYLVDRNDMGKGTKVSLQSIQVTNPPVPKVANPIHVGETLYWNIHGAPVVWPLPKQMFAYIMGEEDRLKQYKLIPDPGPAKWKFSSNTFFKQSPESAPLPPNGTINNNARTEDVRMPGGFITVSANGNDPKSGIVWVNMPFSKNANREVVAGVLRAFDAADVSKGQLWSSADSGVPADNLGMFAKFNPPTVANGKVYVGAFQEERFDNGAHKKLVGGNQPALVIYGPK